MSFSGELTKGAIKALSRTLQCLSKIGSEVTVESSADKLILRALAPSHAAYALVQLQSTLFAADSFCNLDESGHPLPLTPHSQASDPSLSAYLKCKVHLKQWLLAFRHAPHLEHMRWEMSNKENVLQVTASVAGINSTYKIPFESQHNILQADFPRSSSPNLLQFKPALLLKILDQFSQKLSEVTLLIDSLERTHPDGSVEVETELKLKSFDTPPPSHMLQGGTDTLMDPVNTETNIPHQMLERFEHAPVSNELTFNVKEVRAFLSYADSLGEYDVRVRFGSMGQPMLFETLHRHMPGAYATADEERPPLKMELVVATLAESQTQSHSASQAAHSQQASQASQQQQQLSQGRARVPPRQQSAGEARPLSPPHLPAASQSASQIFQQKQSAVMPSDSIAHQQQGGSEAEDYAPPTP